MHASICPGCRVLLLVMLLGPNTIAGSLGVPVMTIGASIASLHGLSVGPARLPATAGILADEMGLGKTIQTIALLAHLACEK